MNPAEELKKIANALEKKSADAEENENISFLSANSKQEILSVIEKAIVKAKEIRDLADEIVAKIVENVTINGEEVNSTDVDFGSIPGETISGSTDDPTAKLFYGLLDGNAKSVLNLILGDLLF